MFKILLPLNTMFLWKVKTTIRTFESHRNRGLLEFQKKRKVYAGKRSVSIVNSIFRRLDISLRTIDHHWIDFKSIKVNETENTVVRVL